MAKKSAAQTKPALIAKQYQLLPVVGPSAGVDLRTSPTLLAADRARTLLNFTLTEPGALVVRPGYQAFSSQLSTGRIQGGARVYFNTAIPAAASTAVTVIAYGGSVYTLTDSGGVSAALLSGLSTNEYSFPSDRDLVAVFDGLSTAIRKSTNGSSWTRFGLAPSAVGATLSSLSTGGLSSGEYAISFTYKARGLAVESNAPAESTLLLSASSGAINVVVPNSTDPQIGAFVTYARKVSAGETVLRKVSSQAQSTGANSTYVLTSTNWTTNDEIPTDHTLPPVLSFGVVWKNRWWARHATITNRLHFTQLFQPQSWPGLFYIDIPFERGDSIQALVPLGDTLLVFGSTKIFIILGQTSLDFDVRPTIASEDGALGFRSVAAIENGVVHAGASGVYIFDGTTDRLLSFDIEPAWQDLIETAGSPELSRTALVYHQAKKELRVAVARRYPSAAPGEWVMDMNRTRTTQTPAWTATDREIGGFIPWDGPETQAGSRGRLFSWTQTVARVYEESVGTSANSSNLTAEYEGGGLTLGTHRARWVDLRVEYEPHAGQCSVEPVVDGVSQGTQAINIGAGLAAYGSATYGTSVYAGAGRRQAYVMLPVGADGRTFVLKLTYSGQDTARIFAYHPGFVPETASRAFSE